MPSPHRLSVLFCRAVAASLVVMLVACSGGDDDNSQAVQKTTTQKVAVPGAKVALDLASIDVQSAGPALNLDAKTKVAVMTQTRQYVEEAIVRPLLSGKKVRGQYAKFFSPTVVKAATAAPDRGALTDEGVGKVNGDVSAPKTKVAMHALVGTDGTVQYIATDFTLKVKSKLDGQPLRINRNTELTFEKTPGGKWLVSAYSVIATRSAGSSKKSASATTSTTGKS